MAVDAAEICLLFGDWQIQRWWSCMSRAEWASWVQAVGSVAAIFAVLLQIRYERRSRERERASRIREILERSVGAIQDIREYCEKSPLIFASLSIGYLQSTAVVELQETLSASSRQLDRLPFWDIPDSYLAMELQSVSKAVSLLRISMNHAKDDASLMLKNLLNACEKAEEAFNKQLAGRRKA